MNNNEVFEKNTKSNFVNNLNTSNSNNEAKRLEEKVKTYRQQQNPIGNNVSNNSLGKNNTTSNRMNTSQRRFGRPQNSTLTNKLANKGLQSVGVPAGISNKIVDSKVGQKAISKATSKIPGLSLLDRLTGGRTNEIEESAIGEGFQNFTVPKKVVKRIIIAAPFVLTIIVFCCLIMSASQIYLNAITFGHADWLDDEQQQKKLEKLVEENNSFNSDDFDNVDEIIEDNSDDLFGYADMAMSETSMYNIKLASLNLMPVLSAKFNEADLSELNDYYSGFSNYTEEGYDMNVVYNFFFKLMYIEKYYKSNYNVNLDMPLLMAVLRLQSSDYGEVFSSNIKNYDVSLKEKNPMFSYDYDWSGYVTTKTSSEHDIELLVQRMVVKTSGTCRNTVTGLCYKIADDATYKEFLKEFIEKKYYTDGIAISKRNDNVVNADDTSSKYVNAMIDLAEKELNSSNIDYNVKYNSYFGNNADTPWSASFVSYLAKETKVNGVSLSPELIPNASWSVGTLLNSFATREATNLNFYYNDSCTSLKGKNELTLDYVPKAGDYIFFDWDNDTENTFESTSSGTVDHVGVVVNYKDGIITTIEGGLAGSQGLKKVKRNITSCEIVGFGSWYEGEVTQSNQNIGNNGSSTQTPFTKYALTDDQLLQLASLCAREQGSAKGAAAEASLMANLFEIKGSKHGTGATGLYNYVKNGGWFANAAKNMERRDASAEIVAAVRSVLVEGKRTLPGYINEHDCWNCNKTNTCSDGSKGDICTVTNDGKSIDKTNRDEYVQYTTRISNVYGSSYTFYSFPAKNSDPFGYTSEKLRESIGECYFDYDTGQPINCN